LAQLVPGLALLVAAAIWGFTFPLVKDALDDVGTLQFLAMRFGIATVTYVVLWPKVARTAARIGVAGLVTGALLAAGHIFQTAGLELTRSTNAGFITGLYVVFTPLLATIFLRRHLSRVVLFGVVLTTAGLALMSLQTEGGRVTVNLGDMLVLLCAVAYGGQIVAVAKWAPGMDARVLTVQQFAVTFVACSLLVPAEGVTTRFTTDVWIALIATAIGSSVYGIGIQTWAQQRISPTRAAVIFSMEAPFAGLAGYLLANERLGSRAWVGAALILIGMLVVEVRPAPATMEA
jgi:drug/metabolite transporter (DMT)-like permease